MHGVASTVPLDDLSEVSAVEPGGVGVPVVVGLELACQVGPDSFGQVS
jgi:hypothetical protein